jgi:hypothetical protein
VPAYAVLHDPSDAIATEPNAEPRQIVIPMKYVLARRGLQLRNLILCEFHGMIPLLPI